MQCWKDVTPGSHGPSRIPRTEAQGGNLVVEGTELVLRLTRAEKLEGVHGDLRVSLSAVAGVEVLDDAHQAADMVGIKVGTRIPGVVEVPQSTGRAPSSPLSTETRPVGCG